MSKFKPMLCAKANIDNLTPPYLISPKLDGVRALVGDGVIVSRTLKSIPNKTIQEMFSDSFIQYLDGELIVGEPTDPLCFNKTTSVVMSRDKEESVTFFVFDHFQHPKLGFSERLDLAKFIAEEWKDKEKNGFTYKLRVLPHKMSFSSKEILEDEKIALSMGYEGIVLRNPKSTYKYGRATERENSLLKLKRFEDSEAVIIDFVELLHNENEQTTDNLGNSKRSSHKENKRSGETLGAIVVKDVKTGIEFEIGTGFSSDQRKHIWDNRENYHSKQLTYKYFPVGVLDKPRHPVFKGFRKEGF